MGANVFLLNVSRSQVSIIVFLKMPQQVSPALIYLGHFVAFCSDVSNKFFTISIKYKKKSKSLHELLYEDLDPTSTCDPAIGFKAETGASVITVLLQ